MRLWVQVSALVLVAVIVAGSALYFGSGYGGPFRRIYSFGEVSCAGFPTFLSGDRQVGRLMASRGDEVYVTVYLSQNGGDLSSRGMLKVEFRENIAKADTQRMENKISIGADMTIPVTVGPFPVKSATPPPITQMNIMVFWNDDYLPCGKAGVERIV